MSCSASTRPPGSTSSARPRTEIPRGHDVYPLRWRLFWLGTGWVMVAGIVVLSLIPVPPGPAGMSDKVAHMLAYGVLALWFCGIYLRDRHWRVALWLVGMGIMLELLQGMDDSRYGETADALANLAGVVVALIIAGAGLGGWCERVESVLQGWRRRR